MTRDEAFATAPERFLENPGATGAMGALMDEYARAAELLCAHVETIDQATFEAERESADPWTASPRAICSHVRRAALGYANDIRKARGLPHEVRGPSLPDGGVFVDDPAALRPALVEALQYTEGALEGLYDASEEEVAKITFEVPWGPTFDPDMLLEHAIVHLLRHRRQLERWVA
jgi:uncharacterized damage-inducible protein DinB